MTGLANDLRIARPDDSYQSLVDAYAGLTHAQVADFHACLTMLLINQVGDAGLVGRAIAEALRVVRSTKREEP